MGYTKSALQGVSWMSGFRVANRLLTFLKIAILARVLTPSQFGVFGIASLLLALLEILTETGINVVLIQKKDSIEHYLDSAWVVSIVRGILICLTILVSAPLVATFFKTPAALNLIMLISLSPLIKGFINPAEVTFRKELKFNYEFRFRTILFLTDGLVAIVVALITHSVYSLAAGLLAGSILEVILSFVFIKPTPRFKLNREYIKEIFHKGKWVTAYGIFNYFGENGDNIIVGRILGATTLGIYQLAYKISYIPISEITDVMNSVIFPVYSRIDEDRKRLMLAFWKTTGVMFLLALAAGGIIFVFPSQVIEIILGPQWLSAVGVLKVLAVYGIVRASLGSFSSLFLAAEKQNYVTTIIFIRFIVLAITIYPFVLRWGMLGAGYSALFSAVVEIPFIFYYLIKLMKEKQ
jgi:lipopolysaccharide exporter